MGQQKFNIYYKLGNPNRNGFCKIYIRVVTNIREFKIPTNIRIEKKHFSNGKAIKVFNKNEINEHLLKLYNDLERRLLKACADDIIIDENVILGINISEVKYYDYFNQYLLSRKGIIKESTVTSLKLSISRASNIPLSLITKDFLPSIERNMISLGLDNNTIHKDTKKNKQILKQAVKDGLINESAIIDYIVPKYVQKIPEYLTLDELDNFYNITKEIKKEQKKISGYYFLLSCYTGYRLGDLLSFDYHQRIKDEKLILRAGKNNKIVSIPVYPKLKEILEFCKENKLSISQQNFRLYVKEIASDIGIARNIKIHTARHTFAMMLISKGFSIDEVAELLGDTPEVARIYARITNRHLEDKIMERLN